MTKHSGRFALVALAVLISAGGSQAGDSDKYRNVSPDIEAWIESLTDKQDIPCCATADGGVPDAWETGPHRYRVEIHGAWLDVPDAGRPWVSAAFCPVP